MEELFVPYNLALDLKNLGFNEECFAWYNYTSLTFFGDDSLLDMYAAGEENRPYAPLFQQAFDWFTNKGYHSYIIGAYPWFRYYINSEDNTWEGYKDNSLKNIRIACIEKLIEIIKSS